METETEVIPEAPKKKRSKKKMGKIARIHKLHEEGKSVKEIAEKTGTKEQLVRSYLWRASHPIEYKKLLSRYFAKKKAKAIADSGKKE